jgi:DNA-binding CsgD family transcriptional regulator
VAVPKPEDGLHARRLPSPHLPEGLAHWAATEPAPLAALAEVPAPGSAAAAAAEGEPPRGRDLLRVGIPRLMGKLLTARSVREREQHVWAALHDAGFDWCEYGTLENTAEGLQPRSFVGTYANAAWVQRCFGARHHEVDPRLVEAAGSGLPLVWDLAVLRARAAGGPARLQQMVDDLQASGIGSGVLISLSVPSSPGLRVVVSLASATAGSGWIVDALLGKALTFALSMHEFHARYTRLPAAPTPGDAPLGEAARAPLTAVQQEILQGLEQGLSDKEIALRLAISTYAVDYHMRQLRRQFGVRNRVQLAGMGSHKSPSEPG